MSALRFAFRQLLKSPGFTTTAVLTLALGIGANTAFFSLMNTVMFQRFPYHDPDRLVHLLRTSPQSPTWPHSVPNFLDYRASNDAFEDMAAFVRARFSLVTPDFPAESLRGIAATGNFFSTLGSQAFLGRVFNADEDQPGRNQVIVLSHSFWERRFGGDTNIIGRVVRVDGESATIIGVMPAAFDCPQLWGPIDAWRPLVFTAEQRQQRNNHWLSSIARIRPELSVRQAEAAMKGLAARLAAAYPEHNADNSVRLAPLQEAIGDAASRRFAWLTLGLTAFVLLIACLNLANLLLARASARSRELAVRLALGVGRWRLIRQMLVESMVVSMLGGIAGIGLALWLGDFVGSHINHPFFPRGLDVKIDSRVLLFGVLCSMITGLLFGLGPAWQACKTDMNEVLKAGGRGTTLNRPQQRLRHALIVGQVAFALALLSGTGLFIRGLDRFIHEEPGWRVDGLLTAGLSLSSAKYVSADERRSFVERLEQRLSTSPGIEHVAISSSLPLWTLGSTRGFLIEGQVAPLPGQEPLLNSETVTPGYFDTLGIRLREGRVFTPRDSTNSAEVVVINESMAKRFWPGESPLGKRIGNAGDANPKWQEIIGVVNDIRFPANLGRPDTRWQTYRPYAQVSRPFIHIELRTTAAPASAAAALRQVLAELDPDLPANELEPARVRVERLLSHFTVAGRFLGTFAILSVALATLGIYGVISYFVAQRTNEIGIRMALGAGLGDVMWLVVSKGLFLSGLGVLLGLGGAFGIASLLAAAVPELSSQDPPMLGICVLALVIAALFASWLPAQRAAKVNPIEALRCE